ncbi:MAG: dihydropteroate synthase [Sphingobacteriaceae bacterium]
MDKDTFFKKKTTLNVGGKLLDLSNQKVMGILNLTPDSFYVNSRKINIAEALQQTARMLNDGADFIDAGAYSSRPGAEDISEQQEIDRLIPVIEAIVKEFPDVILSVDTFRAAVAELAIGAGAHIINDISGGQLDENMFSTVARLQVPYILMHMKGTPQNMQHNPQYEDVVEAVYDYLFEKQEQLKLLGVHDVIIDPGFGFAKTLHHNYKLMQNLERFNLLKLPLLTGISRKGMIYKVTGGDAANALNGTTVLNTIALIKGANILRVHDVKEAVETIKLFQMVNNA